MRNPFKIFFRKKEYANSGVYFLPDGTVAIKSEGGDRFIDEGYNRNSDVYSIIRLAAGKLGQVPWYVYRVKKGRTKELKAYVQMSSRNRNPDRVKEIQALRKKALDESIVENELSELLSRPNRNQGQDSFFEYLYGYKLLTGEGNIWKNRGNNPTGPVLELFTIPKRYLEHIQRPGDPWGIEGWTLNLGVMARYNVPFEDIIMWKFPCYKFDPTSLIHLRGQAPLESMQLDLDASNENKRVRAKLNKNQGARGALIDQTGDGKNPVTLTPQQESDLRRVINSKINNNDVAGSVAVLSGMWSYLSMGMDAGQLRVIEQSNLTKQDFCAGFNVPYEFFNPETTFANKEQAGRHFLYNHLAPAAYSLRDEMNRGLLKDFGLSDSFYIIEPDVMSLPEAMEDMHKMVDMLTKAWWLSPNQRLMRMGEDPSNDPNMEKIYIPSGLTPMDQANQDIGAPMNEEEDQLEEEGLV